MIKKEEIKFGTLYIVSIPIGNDDDITIRALKVLKSVDIVVCEEPKVGARVLHKYNLSQRMELLNEQNEATKTPEIIGLLKKGKNIALICDGGTPVFADPGLLLVQSCIRSEISIKVIPGVTSLMTALVRSGFSLDQFLYAGFLSRKKEERILQLKRLSTEKRTVVLFETPYRLVPLLESAVKIMPDRRAYIGCNLTFPFETHHYGSFEELYEKFKNSKFKGEFVVCFDGSPIGVEEEYLEEKTQSRSTHPSNFDYGFLSEKQKFQPSKNKKTRKTTNQKHSGYKKFTKKSRKRK